LTGTGALMIFTRNLEYLRPCMSAASIQVLTAARTSESPLRAESRADAGWDLIWAVGERKITLHSRRDPFAEADRLAAEVLAGPPVDGCVIAGVAGMYHLNAIAARLRPGSTMVVIDLDPVLFATALQYCDLNKLSQYRLHYHFIVNSDVETAKREFRMILKKMDRFDLVSFVHPAMRRIAPEPYQRLMEEIASEIKLERMDRDTRAASGYSWLENAVDNFPYLLRSPSLEEFGKCFAGSTAIVAAAGPTLSDAIPVIQKLAPQCLVFAVGTALRSLLAAGIVPDFMVALDSDPQTLRQLPAEGEILPWLAAAPSVPPPMCEKFASRSFFYTFSGMKGFNRRLTGAGFPLPVMNVGGTVSLTAIDIALLAGCETVLLCGLDLAVGADGTTHATNSMYDGCRADQQNLIPVRGNYADKVLTTPQFADYIKQMNAYLLDMTAVSKAVFYNVTTGGAMIEHTRLICPDDITPEICCFGIEGKNSLLRRLHDDAVTPSPRKRQNFLRHLGSELEFLCRDAGAAIKLCDELLGGQEAEERAERLGRLDSQLKNNSAIEFIEPALEGVLLRLRQGNRTDKSQSERLLDGKSLYQEILRAAGLFANKINNMLKTL